MTFTASQGSGSKSEDMLATIMKQLIAMDVCLQSMEGRLHAVDSIKAKVTALEESTGELGAQQDTLSSAVERIRAAAVGRGVTRMMEVKTSSLPCTNSSSPSMMGLAIRYRGSTGASGTSRSAGRRNRNTSLWPPAIFSMTHNSGSIGWSSMGVVHPGHNSSNW
jgi:hypothetical protein